MTNMTVPELCRAWGLDPKMVRRKLRRALATGALIEQHAHGARWVVTDEVAAFIERLRK